MIIERLVSERVYGELWVDGSFMTEKIDPNDADIVLLLRAEAYESYSATQRAVVDWLLSNLKQSHRVDSYVGFAYPLGHASHAEGEFMRAYWQYGFDRDEDMKGIAAVQYMP
jgi:uncharacterized protein DUF6932